MTEGRDYLELSYRSINCFANDGKLDVQELEGLMAIVLKDGVVDENEKRVLKNIFGRLKDVDLDQAMQEKIGAIKARYL